MPKRTHADAMITKKNILQAALKMFSSNGYEKTSLSDIAREANVTRGAIYWHFEDKGELLYELCREVAKDKRFPEYIMMATREDEEDPLGCLKKWIMMHTHENAEEFFASEIYKIVDGVFSRRYGDEKTRDRIFDLVSIRMYHITEALQNAIRRHQLPPDLNVEMAASFLHTVLLGYVSTLQSDRLMKPLLRFPHAADYIIESIKQFRK